MLDKKKSTVRFIVKPVGEPCYETTTAQYPTCPAMQKDFPDPPCLLLCYKQYGTLSLQAFVKFCHLQQQPCIEVLWLEVWIIGTEMNDKER